MEHFVVQDLIQQGWVRGGEGRGGKGEGRGGLSGAAGEYPLVT